MPKKHIKSTNNLLLEWKLISIIILGFAILFFCLSFTYKNEKKPGKGKAIKTICIDPGHGGKDPGCNGADHNEKEVTLAIALKLGKLIEENLKDVKVIYTRKTDMFVELEERAQIANRNNADLFISIHCNAAAKYVYVKDKNGKTKIKTWKDKKGKIHKYETANPIPYGSDTYVMGTKNEKGAMEVAKRENASMLMEDNYEKTYGGFDPNSDEAYIIMTMTISAYVEQSAKFAAKIQKEYKEKSGRIDKGVQRQSIWVLWRAAMPSILTEVGFLTNPREEKFLGSEKGQYSLACSIFRAIRNYKNDVEGTNLKFDDEIEKMQALDNENEKYFEEHPEEKGVGVVKEVVEDSVKDPVELAVKTDDVKANDKYNSLIKSADDKMKEKKFDEAITIYNQALEVKKNDKYATDKIKEANIGIAIVKKEEADKLKCGNEVDEKYKKMIAVADELFGKQKWEQAKTLYTDAAVFKPGDKYPKTKIAECDKNISLKQGAIDEASAKKYNDIIKEADKLFDQKKWEDSKKKYKEAIPLIPHPDYPQKRIKEIEDIQEALSKQDTDTDKTSPKDLINNYAGQNKKDTTKKNSVIDEKLVVEFRVQFTSSDKEIEASSPKLKGLEKVSYYKVGAILKYTAGNYSKPAEAASYQTKVRELGYKDAFVVAFKNGQRIDYKEALKLVK